MKIELEASLALERTAMATKGDRSSKLSIDVPLICLRQAQDIIYYMAEQPIRVIIECLTPNTPPDEAIERGGKKVADAPE